MTFEEARKTHLAEFDSAVIELRKVVADPTWCNRDYKLFRKCHQEFLDSMARIERLNTAEQTATQ